MWTTASDVIGSWIGDDAPTDPNLVQVWIERAERLIRREIPGIRERLESGTEPDLVDTVTDVTVAMVTRVFRNPAGHRSITGQEATGPFSGSNTITFGGDNPGALTLLPSELDALAAPDSAKSGAVFSISMLGSPGPGIHRPWCSLAFGARYCSCGSDINRLEGPLFEAPTGGGL